MFPFLSNPTIKIFFGLFVYFDNCNGLQLPILIMKILLPCYIYTPHSCILVYHKLFIVAESLWLSAGPPNCYE